MSKQVNLYEAKTRLSRLVDEAAKGNEIVIAKNNKPVARLVALGKPGRAKKRKLGASNHRFVEVTPSAAADAKIAKDFENGRLWPPTT
jgi:prevent-host-death family protein